MSYRIDTTYLHLGADDSAIPLPVTDTFWQDLGNGGLDHLGPGRLVSQFVCDADWTSWEMHPRGEEVVCLLSGKVELVLSTDGVEQATVLDQVGAFVIVPRGTWHTANVSEPSSLLFITAGEGTDHRSR